jgi:hypothetical protein
MATMCRLAIIGVLLVGLTFAAAFAFQAWGDNAFIALTLPAALLVLPATRLAERAATARTLWLIFGVAIALRAIALSFEPLLSTDIYRYIWDGKVQADGINPYRFVPADPALASLRDSAIFPNINRADYAVTIYPPVAQVFFLLVTRIAANTLVMRLALLACEAVTVVIILRVLKRLQQPRTRIVAYLWHPLPVWEIVNNGHVDGLMVCLMFLGIWFSLGGRFIRGGVAIALACLAKPLALPALAVIWRPWNWKMVLVVIATVGLCYLPYLSVGWNVFGFLTKGYLIEEGVSTGSGLWLLDLWRLIFGVHRGDVVVYMTCAASLMFAGTVWTWSRPQRSEAFDLAGINRLLLAGLVLLSPNYPWYFLVLVPFLALFGNAPTWAATIGAILLTDEVETDYQIPAMLVKAGLFGAIFVSVLWSMRRKAIMPPISREPAT